MTSSIIVRLYSSDKNLLWVSRAIRAWWWCCGKEILLRYERRLSASPAQRRQCECNFLGRRGFKCLGVAIAHNLYRNIVNIDVYTEFELLEVKVPIIFLSMAGFSPPREGRYRTSYAKSSRMLMEFPLGKISQELHNIRRRQDFSNFGFRSILPYYSTIYLS